MVRCPRSISSSSTARVLSLATLSRRSFWPDASPRLVRLLHASPLPPKATAEFGLERCRTTPFSWLRSSVATSRA